MIQDKYCFTKLISLYYILLLLLLFLFTSFIDAESQQNVILKDHEFHMSRECLDYFRNDETSWNLWRNSYINARYELSSVDNSIKWSNILSPRMKKRIGVFYSANVSSCIYNIQNTPVWYVTIYKGGNNNIRGNLQVVLVCH